MTDTASRTPAGPVHRIGVVEDHEAVVMGLEAMLAPYPSLMVCGSAPTVLCALGAGARAGSGDPRPTPRGRLVPENQRRRSPRRGFGNPHLHRCRKPVPRAVLAAKAGVLGVVRKSETSDVVVAAIAAAVAGQPVVTTEWAAAVDGDPHLAEVDLSPRQRDVLALYASGEKADRVARLTGLTTHTVNDYLGRIRTKYANAGRPANTKTDLYKRAVEDGWLPVPERGLR